MLFYFLMTPKLLIKPNSTLDDWFFVLKIEIEIKIKIKVKVEIKKIDN